MMKIQIALATFVATLALTGHSGADPAPGPSDAQIVGIVLAADDIDVAYGKLALAGTKDPQVRAFAEQMVSEHSAVQKSVRELAAKLGVTAADSDVATGLKAKAKEITAKLGALKGKALEKFYIDNEVAYHQLVTDALAATLIPSARNKELKAALEGAQPLFLGHLEHARRVQAALSGGGMK
jgi:putative membrane protein